MDRNSAIGLSLIAVIFIVYIYFLAPSAPTPEQLPQQPTIAQSDTTRNETVLEPTAIDSSSIVTETQIQNEDVAYSFNNHGVISSAELKKFKTYYQKPLMLATSKDSRFELIGNINGKSVDLYKLFYTSQQSEKDDSTVITYTTSIDNASIKHIYSIPKSGYEVRYLLQTSGITFAENVAFSWKNNIIAQEKQLDISRIKTTTNWYSTVDGFDNISEDALDFETKTVAGPVQWAGVRAKFFLTAIIADKSFASGDFSTVAAPDSAHVKNTTINLMLPAADLQNKTAGFRYFFGPNDYRLLGQVQDVESFQRNVYLGWPPVKWVNQFVIVPIFHLLEKVFSNYGVIIMILVIIIRLLLTPLSYSSYLGMAKMRLLKPELDLIKEKNGDNMAQAQQDQMKLYQQAGVNPFSGCIPLLLQLPILLAMFYFFPVSIEFRQKHFLWAEDLSTYDSILSLPFSIPGYGDHVSLFVLLMTASTLISTWQNNQISGSVQGPMKTVSYIMPVVFLFILNSFSAALSFYYFVSNIFGFAQQLVIRRFVDEEKIKSVMADHKKKMTESGGTTGKKSKFMARLEEAMKASEEAKKKNSRK